MIQDSDELTDTYRLVAVGGPAPVGPGRPGSPSVFKDSLLVVTIIIIINICTETLQVRADGGSETGKLIT